MAVVAVVKEADAREHRVALTPAVVANLVAAGHRILVEKKAGVAAEYPDADYADSGAELTTASAALKEAEVLVSVSAPPPAQVAKMGAGALVIGQFAGVAVTDYPAQVTLLDLTKLPRQISRAQSMDVLTSQASVAGYRAAVLAAYKYPRYFPMMVTAAGTAKPASVLVLGAGVAGLQAIATARRLGARVTGYDVRPAAREEVTSLGAQFLATSVEAVGDGGYARELSKAEAAQQQAELGAAIAKFDVVIATAKVPGRKPPLLVKADTIKAMRRGALLIDMAASELGGNVAGSEPGAEKVTRNGVVIIGADNLAAEMAPAASAAYARNVAAVLAEVLVPSSADGIARDGAAVHIDVTDEVIGAMVVGDAGPPATASGDSDVDQVDGANA